MPDYILHKVKKGDTLWGISRKYEIEEHKIVQANPEKIKLVKKGSSYTPVIYEGDTLRIPQPDEESRAYIIRGKNSLGMGESAEYELLDSEENPPHYPSEKITWEFYVEEGEENWRKLRLEKEKTGQKFTIIFTNQKLKSKKVRIEAHMKRESSNEKLAEFFMTLDGEDVPEIKKLELLDVNRNKINRKLSYAETLFVHAQCTGMEGETLYFTLWEDDAPGAGHSKENEENIIVTKQASVIQGLAEVSFSLVYSTMAPIANRKIPYGQKDEGRYHEYYVTVSRHEGSPEEKSSENVEVINPDYTPPPKPQPKKKKAPQPQPAAPKVIHKDKVNNYPKPPASAWKEPKIIKVSLRDGYGKEWTRRPKYGEKMQVYIESENMVNRKIRVRIYDKDKFSDDLLHEEDRIVSANSSYLTISLTKAMQDKGGDFWYQDIFAEVSLYETRQTLKSTIIEVDKTDFSIPKTEGENVVTKNSSEKRKEDKDCVCKQYDLIWGNKVSCEFRKKVVGICKELWPNNWKNTANNLMAVMAWETGESFSPSIKNPNSSATGLIQFMKNTAEDLGTTVEDLAKMTALEQLDYVRKYFYPQRNKKLEFVDFYLQVLFPASMGKPDEHVVFSKDGKGLDKNDKNYSLRIKAYPVNKGFDTNPKYGNNDGMVTKAEIKKGIQKYIDKGKINKATTFSCKVLAKKEEKKESIGKWHDPVDNPMRTKYNSYGNIKPVNGAYGDVRNGYTKYHSGLDLFALPYIKDEFEGTKVYASLDGIVTDTTAGPQAGKAIRLKINNVKDLLEQEKKVNYKLEFSKGEEMGINIKETDTVYFIYLHLSKVLVKNNQTVKAGDLIGYTGVSGSIATNIPSPHLHLEIATIENAYRTGKTRRTNPARFIKLGSYNTKEQDDAVNYKYSENGHKTKWNAPKQDQTKD